jgi:6-phosphogluconolactonase
MKNSPFSDQTLLSTPLSRAPRSFWVPDNQPQLKVAADAEASAAECSAYITQYLTEVLASQQIATFAISGGKTPALLFDRLAASKLDWQKIHIFWVDERCVPPDDEQSNYRLANQHLLTAAKISPHNVHRVHGELIPEEGAIHYLETIKEFFRLDEHGLPVFDLIHRGIGPDAHTASLFPGDQLTSNITGIAANVWVEKLKSHRVTLLPGVLRATKRTVLQVAGADKVEAVYNVLKGPDDVLHYPCQIASRDSKATWFLDKAATAKL